MEVFVSSAVESRLFNAVDKLSKFEIGLLLATCSEKSTYVMATIPTPPLIPQDGKKGKSSAAPKEQQVWNDTFREWLLDHYTQVTRMLTGGLSICGVYLLASPSTISQFEQNIHSFINNDLPATSSTSTLAQNRYFFSCALTRKISGKLVTKQVAKSVVLKSQKKISGIHSFSTNYTISISIPVPSSAPKQQTFRKHVQNALKNVAAELAKSKVLIDGKYAPSDIAMDKNKNVSTRSNHSVEFFTPIASSKPQQGDHFSASGTILLIGDIAARSYSISKISSASAIECLKNDIVRTLQNRFEILDEDWDNYVDEKGESHNPFFSKLPLSYKRSFFFPRRVFVGVEGVSLCDYILKHEKMEESAERFRELTSLQPPKKLEEWLTCPEKFDEAAIRANEAESKSPRKANSKPTSPIKSSKLAKAAAKSPKVKKSPKSAAKSPKVKKSPKAAKGRNSPLIEEKKRTKQDDNDDDEVEERTGSGNSEPVRKAQTSSNTSIVIAAVVCLFAALLMFSRM